MLHLHEHVTRIYQFVLQCGLQMCTIYTPQEVFLPFCKVHLHAYIMALTLTFDHPDRYPLHPVWRMAM